MDGIIQEVLRDCECDACNAGLNTLHNNERRGYKKILIEKIEQFNFEWLPEGRITKIIPKNVLIGDNQE